VTGLVYDNISKGMGYEAQVLKRSATGALKSGVAGTLAGPEIFAFVERHVRITPDYALPAKMVGAMNDREDVGALTPLR
jgi:hypothetical protein